MQQHETLTRSVDSLAGIGTQSVKRLNNLGLYSIQDLLFWLPYRYIDKTRITPISALRSGMQALICGTIDSVETRPGKRKSLLCNISDDTGSIYLRFFHFNPNQLAQFKTGTAIGCFGEVRLGFQSLEMVHPDYQLTHNFEKIIESRLTPVYALTEGLQQRTIRNAIEQSINLCLKEDQLINDWLPADIRKQFQLCNIADALLNLHYPAPVDYALSGHPPERNSYLKRLAIDELLAHHLMLLQHKRQQKNYQAAQFPVTKTLKSDFIAKLPFSLTDAQHRVISEIENDCQNSQPMLRLLQGDVGSGKTLIAAYSALLAIHNGYQAAVMAPTELLAEQHMQNFQQWFQPYPVEIGYLTGQLGSKQQKNTLESLAEGKIFLIIGTHALFQEKVKFKRLGLIIIDEQHRFGVQQRLALRKKAEKDSFRPHQLVMTATPIPRTLAMLHYSELDISIIDEMPKGRKPVTTRVIPAERRDEIINKINEWTAKKHQTYWVCTLIEESEMLQCEAAELTLDKLRQALPEVRISLVHGKMKSSEKELVMQDFKNHKIDLLVATTVIEVGVDVPNASLMIIENAERLGLSQLHQLRGRVGRGQEESYCLLIYQSPLSEMSKQRLSVLRQSNDGFFIAEKDLQLRGPGDVMGTRQTGQIELKVAQLDRDQDLLDDVEKIASLIQQQHPESVKPIIQRWLHQASDYSEI